MIGAAKRFEPNLPRRAGLALWAAPLALAMALTDAPPARAQVSEVVVTARKREENVQNIPVAVTAITGSRIDNFNLTTVNQLAEVTPQLIIQQDSSGSGADLSLRGIGSSAENIGIEQSVSVNVDGVYYGQGRAINEGMFDVSEAQILKGPQALFYGKNATAGAIAIQTANPADQYQAMARVGYEFRSVRPYAEGYVSGPVAKNLELRLAFAGSDQQQGYVRNTAPAGIYTGYNVATGSFTSNPTPTPNPWLGQEKQALVRGTLKWTPTSKFTLLLKATFDSDSANNNDLNTITFYCPLGHPQYDLSPTPASCGKNWVAQQAAIPFAMAQVPGGLEGKRNGNDFNDYQSWTFVANATYVDGPITVTSTTGYQRLFNDWGNDEGFTETPLVYGGEHFVWKQVSSEERVLTTFHFPLNFAGGFYYQTTSLDFNQQVNFFGAENSNAPYGDEFVAYDKQSATAGHTYAVFGQAIWKILPNLELTGGARYTHEIKSSYFIQPYVVPGNSPILGIPFTYLFVQGVPIDAHQRFNNVSPEVMLTWRATPNVTVYGGYKTGYKSGGFSDSAIYSTGTLPTDLQFKPETSRGFEGGVKSLWFDNQLRVNLDAFDYLYSNLQVDFFNAPTFNYITLNAASARTKGAEVEVEYAPRAVTGLNLDLEVAYDDAHYGTFIAPCSPAGLTYEEGCTLQRVVTNTTTGAYAFSANCGASAANACDFMNISGAPTALAPRWTAALRGDYSRPIGHGLVLGVSTDIRLSSSYVANGFTSGVTQRIDRQSAYGMIDAVLRLGGDAKRGWEVALIGKNLTNTWVMTGAQGLPLSGGTTGCKISACGTPLLSDQGATVLNPRTVAIQFTYKY